MTRTTPELPIFRHRGAATGITLTLSPPLQSLFIGQISITSDTTQSGVTGTITPGSSPTSPGRVDLRAAPAIFTVLLALASLPQAVLLVISMIYDEANMRVSSIDLKRAIAAVAAVGTAAVPTAAESAE